MAFSSPAFLLLSALLAVLAAAPAHAKLTFQVEPRTTDCFYIAVPGPGHRVAIDFWVLRGGLLDIDLRINSPQGVSLFSALQFESSVREFVANEGGDHEICWNNDMSRWTAKVVQFEATVFDPNGQRIATALNAAEEAPAATKDALNPMEDSVRRLSDSLDSIQRDQKYLLVRETRHRDTAESTNSRIVWYSLMESVILLSISLGQVFYLRKFFGSNQAGRL
jgi:p24 family protein beta-1